MPFTPFHFSVHACVAFPLLRKINFPIFILINVIVDMEPLLVILFNFDYPAHGYAHSFLGATVLGSLWGLIGYYFDNLSKTLMEWLKLNHYSGLKSCLISGITGGWLHVLFDAPLYTDIRPFFPVLNNPLYGLIEIPAMYILCTLLFVPAFILYILRISKV